MKARCRFCACLFVVATVTVTQANTLFVDANTGDNANSGTAAAKPFRTIQKAVYEAIARPGPDVIQIAAGRYEENVVINDTNSVIDSLRLSGVPGVQIADPSEVFVIPLAFTCYQRMQGMMKIIVPLGVNAVSSGLCRAYDRRVVEVTFGDHIHIPA